MKKILVCCNNDFFKKKIKKKNYYFLSNNKKLDVKYLKRINPFLIFFPHWNFLVDKKIVEKFNCIGFHATPLPYGRGGSPIQNMIIRGYKKSKLCAFKLTKKLDNGPIYLKKNFLLTGSGDDIFNRIYYLIFNMMYKLEKNIPKPQKQIGKVFYFKRRKLKQGNLLKVNSVKEAYNLIRMLDISQVNYPKAFIEGEKINIKFKNANMKRGKIEAIAEISRK